MNQNLDLDIFTEAYIKCAMYTECPDEECQSGEFSDEQDRELRGRLPNEVLAEMREDCKAFLKSFGYLLREGEEDQAGHDFWLTRNGHGTGFWDREHIFGTRTKKLVDAAEFYSQYEQIYLQQQEDEK